MRKYFITTFILVLLLTVSCYKGYISADGASLEKYLEPEALKTITENPIDSIWIIDVRPSGAYEKGHIPTAKSYPSSEIMKQLGELPKSQYLIIYCETGGRAQMVIKKLEKEGYTRLFNWGGYKRWKWDFVKD